MRIKPSEKLTNIKLPAIDGTIFETERIIGRPLLLSFFRFASCPFCNLRIHELTKRFDEFGDDFTIVAIFDSPLDNLKRYAERHKSPFPILADEKNEYYKKYAIEYSVIGMLKGPVFRLPTLLKGLFKGYIPIRLKGRMTTMPADFLVDKNGIIQTAYYGKDEGDHLPFDVVKAFSFT